MLVQPHHHTFFFEERLTHLLAGTNPSCLKDWPQDLKVGEYVEAAQREDSLDTDARQLSAEQKNKILFH